MSDHHRPSSEIGGLKFRSDTLRARPTPRPRATRLAPGSAVDPEWVGAQHADGVRSHPLWPRRYLMVQSFGGFEAEQTPSPLRLGPQRDQPQLNPGNTNMSGAGEMSALGWRTGASPPVVIAMQSLSRQGVAQMCELDPAEIETASTEMYPPSPPLLAAASTVPFSCTLQPASSTCPPAYREPRASRVPEIVTVPALLAATRPPVTADASTTEEISSVPTEDRSTSPPSPSGNEFPPVATISPVNRQRSARLSAQDPTESIRTALGSSRGTNL